MYIFSLYTCLQSFPASGSFQMSQFFPSGGQSIGVSASASVLPMNIQDWFPLGWTGWTSLQPKGLSCLLQHPSSKTSILRRSVFFIALLSHPQMTAGKTIALTRRTFVGKIMSLLFNMQSRLAITFLPSTKRLLISWLHQVSLFLLIFQAFNPCKIMRAKLGEISRRSHDHVWSTRVKNITGLMKAANFQSSVQPPLLLFFWNKIISIVDVHYVIVGVQCRVIHNF